MQTASSLDVALSVHSPLSCWNFVRFLPVQVYASWRVFACFALHFCLFVYSFFCGGEKKEHEGLGVLEDLGGVEEGREYYQSKLCVENLNKYKKEIIDIISKIKN